MSRSGKAAFTLVEILVVISVLVLLIALVVPATGKARSKARETVCQGMQRHFGELLMLYTSDHEDYIPGMNTSGFRFEEYRYCSSEEQIATFHQPDSPVQLQDWLTPLAVYDLELPANRAERFNLLLSKFRCPDNDEEAIYYGEPIDVEDFEEYDPMPATSYLMPASFQYWGDREVLGQRVCFSEYLISSKKVPDNWYYELPENYRSRINEVGSSSKKIFVADGSRYLSASGIMDTDIDLHPRFYGALITSGAWRSDSTAYGVAEGSLNWDGISVPRGSMSDGQNLAYSYRHGYGESGGVILPSPPRDSFILSGNSSTFQEIEPAQILDPGSAQGNFGYINAVFYDGHVEVMKDQESRQIEHWYPSGTVITSPEVGMTAVPDGYVVP